MPSPTALLRASTWNIRAAFLTARLLKGSGKFTNAKASPASNAVRVSGASLTAADRPTGAHDASEDKCPPITQITRILVSHLRHLWIITNSPKQNLSSSDTNASPAKDRLRRGETSDRSSTEPACRLSAIRT